MRCGHELKKRTLTNLYNERPTWLELAHKRLDDAVLDAYEWQHELSVEEIVKCYNSPMSNKKLAVKESITIHAPAAEVWNALTNAELIPQYMYGCDAVTDWKPGSSLLWRSAADGKVYVKGAIIAFDPGRLLEYTTFDPNNPAYEDTPSNYATMTFELHAQEGATMLTAIQSGFEHIANGEERYQHAATDRDDLLQKIKTLVESKP